MKNIKCLFFALLILIAGCASTPTGSEAFKGRPPEEIFNRGEKSLSKKHFKQAVTEFEAFDALYPFDPRAEQAQINLIYAYFKSNDPDSALAAADRYIRLYPMSSKIAYVYYLRGVINMERNISWIYNAFPCDPAKRDLSSLTQAFLDFSRLIQLFPNCMYAADAHKRMLHIKNILARRELQVAEFYFARHAYIAAANRACYIVQHLPGSREVPKALIIMIKSYRSMGNDEQANEALQVLKYNYPNQLKQLS